MGLFFNTPKPRVTKIEWKKVRSNLYSLHNFTVRELDKVEEIFRGDMDEERDIDKGIDAAELTKGLQYMREHMNVHYISKEKINALEAEMIKYIGLS